MATAGKPRVRAARVDSTIRKLIVEIERRYELPRGSVRIVRPNGRRIGSDSTVRALLNAW